MIKIALHKLMLIIIVFYAAFSATFIAAEDVCNNGWGQGDVDFWTYMANRGFNHYETRDWVTSFYHIDRIHWDEGWGYAKLDEPDPYIYALPKMMNSGMLLVMGLDDSVKNQSNWKVSSRLQPGGFPAAVSRTPDTMNVFLRDVNNHLIHRTYSGEWKIGDLPTTSTQERLFILCNCEKEMSINSDPVAISHGEHYMDVFFASSEELVRKTWSDGIWGIELPTEYANRRPSNDPLAPGAPYYIHTKPVVVQRSSDTYDVFAFNATWNSLIHYYWSTAAGWRAEDVTGRAGKLQSLQYSDPVVAFRNANILDVFVIGSFDGTLQHFFGSPSSGWEVEKLGNLPPDSKPAVFSRAPDTLNVFTPDRDSHHLIHSYWSPGTGWQTEDLTSLLGGNYFIEGTPAAVLLDQPGGQSIHVFAREYMFLQRLYHFFWSPTSGWAAEVLSGGIATDPIDLSRQGRLDVVALNGWGHLIHHYWTPIQTGWRVKNVNFNPSVSPVFDQLEGTPLIVNRNQNTVDVIGRKGDWSRLFTSANGNTLTSWHTNKEYSDFAAGSLHQFEYKPNDDDSYANASFHYAFSSDRIQMCCRSFNNESPFYRSSIMLHEATHMNFEVHHDSCNGEDCDPWISHTLRDPMADLHLGTYPASNENVVWVPMTTHTPYQLSVESACDFGESPGLDIPQTVYAGITGIANLHRDYQIKNFTGWRCGELRPLY